jgi:DNA-binding response OmpR family regulator
MALTAEVLRDSGNEVTVYSTVDFVRAASRIQPELVVLELNARAAPSLKLARFIRKSLGDRSPAMIFIAIDAEARDDHPASEYGPVIDGPIDPSAFLHLVRDLRQERQASLTSWEPTYEFAVPLYA